jgi:hypothetical protein
MLYLFIGIIIGSFVGKCRTNKNYAYYDAIIASQAKEIQKYKKMIAQARATASD